MEEINVKEEVFNALAGNNLTVSKEWLQVNDEVLLRTLVGQHINKVPDWVTDLEVERCNVDFKLYFKEDRVIYSAIKDNQEEKLLIEEYDGLDWEYYVLYLIKLGLIKK